jgi:hypothetical protein
VEVAVGTGVAVLVWVGAARQGWQSRGRRANMRLCEVWDMDGQPWPLHFWTPASYSCEFSSTPESKDFLQGNQRPLDIPLFVFILSYFFGF